MNETYYDYIPNYNLLYEQDINFIASHQTNKLLHKKGVVHDRKLYDTYKNQLNNMQFAYYTSYVKQNAPNKKIHNGVNQNVSASRASPYIPRRLISHTIRTHPNNNIGKMLLRPMKQGGRTKVKSAKRRQLYSCRRESTVLQLGEEGLPSCVTVGNTNSRKYNLTIVFALPYV